VTLFEHSIKLRQQVIDTERNRLLIMNIRGTKQEKDLKLAPNCLGFGRIHHFERNRTYSTGKWWPKDPLPIDPACKALGLNPIDSVQAQVFQLAACNFRCWYCFVPHENLNGTGKHASWLTSDELISLLLKENSRPAIIDLSGGHPELAPEWILWMMKSLIKAGEEKNYYLWSDDNLSVDFASKYLPISDINFISSYKNYGKVCCFKGFDEDSFAFNTSFSGDHFSHQLLLMNKYLHMNMDVYGYVTLTCSSMEKVESRIKHFLDSLQNIHELLPLRIIPLEIKAFNPVKPRMTVSHLNAIENQYRVVECWAREIDNRFPLKHRNLNITEIMIQV
jgi:uncharacterized Fe-S cluster-containing radical SAM superfamily protein